MTNKTSLESLSHWDQRVKCPELKAALKKLSSISQAAVFLRFWEFHSIEDIADTLGLSWDEADRLVNESLITLRKMLPEKFQLKIKPPSAA